MTALLAMTLLCGAPFVDEALIRGEMEALIAELDSGAYEKAVDAPEQIVLAYERAQGRAPTPDEFHTLLGLRLEMNLKPSELLALAIRGGGPAITWEMCSDFLARKSLAAPSSRTKALAAELMRTEPQPDLSTGAAPVVAQAARKDLPGLAYNTYFGYLHAHSELSDGTGTPEQAYAGARDAGLDFFALTDHGELLRLWPWEDNWSPIRLAADAADAPGAFAALWGFEWSSPLYGHVTVVNSEDYTDCLSEFRLGDLYGWLAERPEAFGRFNHPGCFDFIIADLLHFRLFENAAAQMVGVEVWNEDDGFDVYHYGGNWTGPEPYLDLANLNGWRVAPLGGEDNHRADWGRMGRFRTGVLATELTREAICEAYMSRRFYATEDDNLYLDFRCAGYPMGSVMDGGRRIFLVRSHDGDGETFDEARLYRNGELIETRVVTGEMVLETFEDEDAAGAAYYYVIVKQSDDSDGNGRNDEAISAPIWFGEIDGAKAGCYSRGGDFDNRSAHLSNVLILSLAALVFAVKANRA